jgi:hypothetical protein
MDYSIIIYRLYHIISSYSWIFVCNFLLFLQEYQTLLGCLILILCLTYTIYIYIRYPFWCRQPVFHTFDFWRFFYRTPFVCLSFPIKTKYCDFRKIQTYNYQEITDQQKSLLVDFIQCYYISNESILMTIQPSQIDTYFNGLIEPSYISFYQENQQTLGLITSRPFQLIHSYPQTSNRIIYYMDFLTVHRNHATKKDIARCLIQTHEYNQRIYNPSVQISLLKSQVEPFVGVVPVVQYQTYIYILPKKIRPLPLPPHVSVVQITKQNQSILLDIFDNTNTNMTTLFDIAIFPDSSGFISMLQSKYYIVYCIRQKNIILGVYFFKQTYMQYESSNENQKNIQFVASICNTTLIRDVFYAGFIYSIRNLQKEYSMGILTVEQLAHNPFLMEYWTAIPSQRSYTSYYYFYNYVFPRSPLSPSRCFFLV